MQLSLLVKLSSAFQLPELHGDRGGIILALVLPSDPRERSQRSLEPCHEMTNPGK